MLDIYCFGDSITYGESDALRGGWAERLKTFCIRRARETGAGADCVFNLGLPGESTAGMKGRLGAELDARLEAQNRAIVLLAYGANDASKTGRAFEVSVEDYTENLSRGIDAARKRGCETALLSITPVTAAADGVPNAQRECRRNSFVVEYNTALKELARKKSAPLLDVHARFAGSGRQALFTTDGLHPNAAGHAIIYDLVKGFLFSPRGRRQGL